MVLILIKLCLSGCFTSIVKSSNAISVTVNAIVGVAVGITISITVGITVKDGRFCPVAVTIAICVHVLIISNTKRQAII
jgi:hypothetical protein